MPRITELNVNGKQVPLDADAQRSLLSVLREDLGLTGTKYGCGEGQCGACTVLIDGTPARSCVTTVGYIAKRKITTIENLAQNGRLHPLQQAFLDAGALQCGYCTSGMVLTGYALLRKNARPSHDEIVRAMNGNICRCGTYQRIITAIKQGAKALQGGAA
jgi:aerobic-type carbon monoxide dehydrogenase small subunit (CoxS/CutS family)